MIFVALLCVLVIVLFISWIRLLKQCKKFNVPGPTPLPILGNALMFLEPPSEFLTLLTRLGDKYGHAFRVHFFMNAHVVLTHPKYVEPVVSSSELITKGRSYIYLLEWLGEGLLTATGERWRTHRKFLTPAFHFNILQNFLPVFCKNSQIFRNKLREVADGKPIDIFPLTALAALDNVTESIMGVSVDAQKNSESEYVKAIEILSKIISLRMQIPFLGADWIFNWTSYKTEMDKALKIVHGQTEKVIEARRQDLEKLNITSLSDNDELGIKNRYAFLDLLLLAEIDGKRIDNKKVREEVDTFMFEGHDTTTSGIAYCLFCISKHENVQQKIYEEQMEVLGDVDIDPTYNNLQQMKYLDLVIKEAMRLYPPVPLIERRMTKDVEIAGINLSRGDSAMINIFQMHRNPEMFEDPLEFKPERFNTNALKSPFSWIPFSAGPRNCIGQRFALMEMKVTISAIVRRYKLLPVDHEPHLCADLVLRSKNGVLIRILPRGL